MAFHEKITHSAHNGLPGDNLEERARGRSGVSGAALIEHTTEVQLLSFVCSTGGKGSQPRLWNIQNLGPVPP